jgi:hypothetical protein
MIMSILPGSEALVGGELLCLHHKLGDPLVFQSLTNERWECKEVYIKVLHTPASRVYVQEDIDIVMEAINFMKKEPYVYNNILMNKAHEPGHPLPGFYTYKSKKGKERVDFYLYELKGRCLYAMVTRDGSPAS